MRVVNGTAVHVLNAGPLEAVLAWASRSTNDAKHWLFGYVLHRAAETKCQAVVLAEVVVKLNVERGRVLQEPRSVLEVVSRKRACSRHIGVRDKGKNFLGDWADQI